LLNTIQAPEPNYYFYLLNSNFRRIIFVLSTIPIPHDLSNLGKPIKSI